MAKISPLQFFRQVKQEVKKVSWPGFKQVVKQTGIVLAFVIVFALVLFGFENRFGQK